MIDTAAARRAARAERLAAHFAEQRAAVAAQILEVVEDTTWSEANGAWPATMRRTVTLITYPNGHQARRVETTRNGQIVSSSVDRV